MSLLSFSGFLRFQECVSLRRSDIEFLPNYIKIRIVSSKSDQLSKGNNVIVARTGNATCPVIALQKYIALAGITNTSDEFMFRKVDFCKRDNSYHLRQGGHISYTTARESLIKMLNKLCLTVLCTV